MTSCQALNGAGQIGSPRREVRDLRVSVLDRELDLELLYECPRPTSSAVFFVS